MIVAIASIVFYSFYSFYSSIASIGSIVLIVLWLQRYKSYASGASFSGEMGSFILFLGYEKFINRLALAEQDFFSTLQRYLVSLCANCSPEPSGLQYLAFSTAVLSLQDCSTKPSGLESRAFWIASRTNIFIKCRVLAILSLPSLALPMPTDL